jgi:sterol desaturase/sphingolipid hydroxylase (fatty acid hydroxylase superfamily)
MSEELLKLEPIVRLAALLGVLAPMAAWEVLQPRRQLQVAKAYRWANNWGIVIVDTLLTRLLFPAGLVGIGLFVESQSWGLLQLLALPTWMLVILSIVFLDFLVWLQHVIFHAVPALWRLHRMHHADLDFDVTTGLRFHPLEILISFGVKAGGIVMIGAPAIAVLLFELILSSLALFNHANVSFPRPLERMLRFFLVTPDFHRVHHSWYPNETNSNFGFNLSCWDRLLGTYRAQPRDGHDHMTIGLNLFRNPRWERLDHMLVQPFLGPTDSYPIHQRTENVQSRSEARTDPHRQKSRTTKPPR